MAIIVENGSIVADANSYVDFTGYSAWATARGITVHGNQAHTEEHILRAMDYIESQRFIGHKSTSTQSLQWPRTEVYIDSYSVDSDEIPINLKNAVYETIVTIEDGNFYLSARERQTTQEKIGDITVTYKGNSGSKKETPAVSSALKKIIKPANLVSRA